MTRTYPTYHKSAETGTTGRAPTTAITGSAGRAPTKQPVDFAQPFCDFLTKNPTVFHAVHAIAAELSAAGYTKLSERDEWRLKQNSKYFLERNGSSLIAFIVGSNYDAGNGVAMIAGHVDALTAKLKPIAKLDTKAGYVQLGVAPYAGALNSTWWDRDLAVAGRVVLKDTSGKLHIRLVDINEPIARIPTLAPHFGAIANGPYNLETQMVPIIGLDNDEPGHFNTADADKPSLLSGAGTFAASQPPRLVKAIMSQLGLLDASKIVNWELELYDHQPATRGGLEKELIYGGRIDDKLCSWAAIQGLLETNVSASPSTIKCVGLFDNEEIGSLLRQGARGNFLPSTIERVVESFAPKGKNVASLIGRTFANSFLVSADVTHAVNPNFLGAYLAQHSPRLNVGVTISADASGHMTTDAVSTAIMQRVAEECGCKLQIFQARNDVREGGTVGPMLSSAMGCRAIDLGIPQLSMHSIRATTGALDPGLGAKLFKGFFDHYEKIDAEFRDS